MELDDWQKDFLATPGDKVLCCGRQIGKSTICGIDAEKYASKNSKKTVLMMAPTERQAFALFEKTLGEILLKAPKSIKKGKDKPTKHKITLKNGTKIFCLPVGLSGLGVRFLTVDRLYADEASRIPDEVWTAVTPMLLVTGGDSIYLSTAAGNKGYFADVVLNRENAFNSFTRFTKSSEDIIEKRKICATWTIKQREKAFEHLVREKARMTKLQYAQEYLGLIVEELRQFFPDDLISKCAILKRREKIIKGEYYLGVDVARMGEDESTFEVIDRIEKSRLEQVENIVTKKTLTTDTERRIFMLEDAYKFKQIFIDAYNVGVGVFDHLLEDERTRRKTIAIDHWARPLTRDEKKKTKLKKVDLYKNLKALMEQGKIKLLDDEELKMSLRSIQGEEQENGQLKLFGVSDHIADGLVRAAWCSTTKALNIWIR